MSTRSRYSPRLWQDDSKNACELERKAETVDELMARFSSKPAPRPLLQLIRSSLVVSQEFALTCLLLTRHRAAMQHEDDPNQWRQAASLVVLPLLLILIVGQQHESPAKRVCDALLLAGMLRLVSSVLRTLTASYSSDTVYALAITGMMVHLLACDYRYANGHSRKKAAGIVSLNACLFSTTLLASRLTSNATVYVFVSTSVILFAFYPAARHAIAMQAAYSSFGTLASCKIVCIRTYCALTLVRDSISAYQCRDLSRHVGLVGDTARKNLVWRNVVVNICSRIGLGVRCITKTQDATQWSMGHCSYCTRRWFVI